LGPIGISPNSSARSLWEGAIGQLRAKNGLAAGRRRRAPVSERVARQRRAVREERRHPPRRVAAALVAKVAVLVARHPLRLHRLEQVEAVPAVRQPPLAVVARGVAAPADIRVEVELVLGEAAEELRALGRRKRGDGRLHSRRR
jgi:hypothetical protein